MNKANMGFALFGLGRIDAGKRLAEEAVAEYERAGASAETAGLLGDFGQYLADAGDYKAALGWERVLGLADKALYMAKRHGRNRAYGIVGLRRHGADALAAAEADLEQAWQDGMVELREFAGAELLVM